MPLALLALALSVLAIRTTEFVIAGPIPTGLAHGLFFQSAHSSPKSFSRGKASVVMA